jgi:GR25 family glycosyltransferase involved in LPS biosynthesis
MYKIFYINIDKNGTRNTRFSANVDKMNKYKVERFEGVNVKNMKKDEYYPLFTNKAIEDAERGYKIRDEDLSFGGMGCALSHISLWKKLLSTSYEFFVIFEDDMIVSDEFVDTILQTYRDIQKNIDPDVDFLTFTEIIRRTDDKLETRMKGVYKRDHFWGLCAYIVNRDAASKLLRDIIPIKEQIDSYISYQIIPRNLHVYSCDIDLKMDYTLALYSGVQTKCLECSDNSTIDWIVIGVVILFICMYAIKRNYFIK